MTVVIGRVPDAHGAGNPFDRWILLRLHELEADVTAALEEFRPGEILFLRSVS